MHMLRDQAPKLFNLDVTLYSNIVFSTPLLKWQRKVRSFASTLGVNRSSRDSANAKFARNCAARRPRKFLLAPKLVSLAKCKRRIKLCARATLISLPGRVMKLIIATRNYPDAAFLSFLRYVRSVQKNIYSHMSLHYQRSLIKLTQ